VNDAGESDHLFDSILAGVTGKHGPFDFIIGEPAYCLNCNPELTEKSLVAPRRG